MHYRRGFSLVEVVVSILIFGAMLVLLHSVANSSLTVRTTKDRGIALSIARNKIEALRTGGYAAVPGSGTFTDSLLSLLPPAATTTLTTSDYNAKMKQVQVTVTWRDAGATASSSVSLTTFITQVGSVP